MPEEQGPKTRFVPSNIHLEKPRLVVLAGPQKGETIELPSVPNPLRVGSAEDCELRFDGLAAVHLELNLDTPELGIRIRDRSEGHSRLDGSPIHEAIWTPGATVELNDLELRLQNAGDTLSVLPSQKDHFGSAKGGSLAMREIFGVLEALADSDLTVLFLGETGTGKDVLARSLHHASPRAQKACLTVDCGAIAPSLIESELFGHERGAFTGADKAHVGAFENAAGGTLFLDEVGELPLDVQPKLLRAIDEREIQRVGGTQRKAIDVRIIAATKRDLEEEVKRGRFRQDLFFRLAVVPLKLPPLRHRRKDIPILVEAFLDDFQKRHDKRPMVPDAELHGLSTHDWPGNVRELKNTVERACWLSLTGDGVARFMLPTADALGLDGPKSSTPDLAFDPELSFSDHKQSWEKEFEANYLPWLMERAEGSLSKASRLAKMDRKHLRALLRKHKLIDAPDKSEN